MMKKIWQHYEKQFKYAHQLGACREPVRRNPAAEPFVVDCLILFLMISATPLDFVGGSALNESIQKNGSFERRK
jgi:hypothetical protein